ncbi:helix-turn-helix domain-containing protein [Paraflavitalea speifideaquila]|uniref:helix-turn-helix domain-containing protein n=1 Tax=Paraflavitalea speifideaquila TaxID=3076558 RepID=UPI0028E5576C|nr:helix-turn-helix domain-containing protein [Paraflavitalea speifideiaquila]
MPRKKTDPRFKERIPVFLQMIGDTFHFLRLEKGVSIQQVAKAIKMAPLTISNIEKGSNQGIRYLTFIRLCTYYDVTAREFFSGSGFTYQFYAEGI